MDLAKTLAELRQQRDDIDQAILSLERLANGRPRRRGRPPGRPNSLDKKRPAAPPHTINDRMKAAAE